MHRPLFVVLAIAACGGPPAGQRTQVPEIVTGFSAARWIPNHPSYVIAAHTFRDGQRAFADVSDSLGLAGNWGSKDVSQALTMLLAVDPLSADAVTNLGIDLDGPLAMFSEDVNPTFVAHLTAVEPIQAFFDQQRQHGLITSSVLVDGAEVFTAKLGRELRVGWAIDKDWLWLHFTTPLGSDDGAAWFAHSHHPSGTEWTKRLTWATDLANRLGTRAANVVGFVELRDLVMGLAKQLPHAVACARLIQPVAGAALSFEGDLHHVDARFAIDLGPQVAGIATAMLPPPPGWATASAAAPLAIEMNLDTTAIGNWFTPCAELFGVELETLRNLPVRTARAMVMTFDPDDKTGTGAASADITSPKLFERYLDEIPMRSHFEDDRRFGPFAGKTLSIPFGPKLDYVLTDRFALAGVGDHMLASIVSGPEHGGPAPIFAMSIVPAGLSPKAWAGLLEIADVSHATAIAERLQHWRDVHVGLRLEGTAVVLEASGNRR